MSATTEEASRPTGHRIYLVILVGFVALAIIGLGYVRIGWDRMESACTADSPRESSVEFGWSWVPPGFTCMYADGHNETSLWF